MFLFIFDSDIPSKKLLPTEESLPALGSKYYNLKMINTCSYKKGEITLGSCNVSNKHVHSGPTDKSANRFRNFIPQES